MKHFWWLLRYGDKWFDFDWKRKWKFEFFDLWYDGPHIGVWIGPIGIGMSA